MFIRKFQSVLYALNLSKEGGCLIKKKLMLIHSKQASASPNGPEGGPLEKRPADLTHEQQQTRTNWWQGGIRLPESKNQLEQSGRKVPRVNRLAWVVIVALLVPIAVVVALGV